VQHVDVRVAGRSAATIETGASSTSNTRSKLTKEVSRSTRAFVRPVNGWYTRDTSVAIATRVPAVMSPDTTNCAPMP